MKTKKTNFKKGLIIILVLISLVALVARIAKNRETTLGQVYHYDKEQAISVEAITVKAEAIAAALSYPGTFEPVRETRVSAEMQGKINAMYADVGDVVHKGQPLIQLDNALLKLQLQSVEVQIEGLEADVARFTVLAAADAVQGVQLEKADLGLKAARVQKATLLEQISKTTVYAPFNGVVTAKLSEVGAFAAPGIPLLQITDISELKFTVNVSEADLPLFVTGEKYLVTADAYKEDQLEGKAIMIGSKSNMGSSFPVQFLVRNSNSQKFKSGMFGKVHLNNTMSEMGIMIPTLAISGSSTEPVVYIVSNGKAVQQKIEVLMNIENKSVVKSGLNAGDVVVTRGLINLYDGANVIVK